MRRVFSGKGGRLSQVEEAERAVEEIENETRGLWYLDIQMLNARDRVREGSAEYQELSGKLGKLDKELQVKEKLRVDMIAMVDRLKAEAGGGGMWRQAVKRVGSAWRSKSGRGDATYSWPTDPRFLWTKDGAAGARRLETGPDLGRHVGPAAAEVPSDVLSEQWGLGGRR